MLNSKNQLLQSKDWQKLQTDLKEVTFFEETEKYQFLAIKKRIPLGFYLYLPYGPSLAPTATKTDVKKCFTQIEKLARREDAIFVRIEPQNFTKNAQVQTTNLSESQKKRNVAQYFSLNQSRLKKTKDLNPAETWCLDLTQSVPEILTKFSQGTRTRHNTYQKKGLTVEISKNPADIKYLVELQHKLAKKRHIASFSEEYLKNELAQPFASLFLVRYHQIPTNAKNAPVEKNAELKKNSKPTPKDGEIIAASLFFDYQGTRFYMQSAANLEYKHLPATVALLSHAIFTAKEAGMNTLDFWGIAPENAPSTHPWYGFTEFKKSFGGYEKIYAGTYDYIINPIKYYLYSLLRKINRLKRRIFRTKS